MPFCFISCYLHNFPTNHWRDNYRNSNRSPLVSRSGCECRTSPSPAPEQSSDQWWHLGWAADCCLLGCWPIISLPFHSLQSAAQQLSSVLLLSSRESGEEPGTARHCSKLLIILYWVWALGCCCCWPGHQPSCRPITARRHRPALPLAGGVPPGRRVAARRCGDGGPGHL